MKCTELIFAAVMGLAAISCGSNRIPVPAQIKEPTEAEGTTRIHIVFDDGGDFSEMVETKSGYAPGETAINDVNLFIYDSSGKLYEKLYASGTDALNLHPAVLVNQSYQFFVLCNYGSAITAPATVDDVVQQVYPFANASLGQHGIPMAGSLGMRIVKDGVISVSVKRLVSKIGLSFDRSALLLAQYNVTAVRLKGAPTHIRPWTEGYSDSAMQDGDYASAKDLVSLNGGGEVFFYVPENCAGTKTGISAAKDKTDSNAPNGGNVPYLEIEATYRNHGLGSDNAKFRFYLGINSTNDFNLYRNYIYHYTLRPSDDSILDPYFKIDAGDISSSRSLSWTPKSLSMLYGQTLSPVLSVQPADLGFTLTPSGSWSGNATWAQSGKTVSVHALYDGTAGVGMSLTASAGVPGKAGYVTTTLPVNIRNTRVTEYEDPVITFGIGSDIKAYGNTAFSPDVTSLKVTQRSRTIYNGVAGEWSSRIDVTSSTTFKYSKDGSNYTSGRPSYSAASLGTTGKARAGVGTLYISGTVNGKTSVGSATIYQEANVKSSTAGTALNGRSQDCYKDVSTVNLSSSMTSAGDIPASGGSSYGLLGRDMIRHYSTDSYTKYDYYYTWTAYAGDPNAKEYAFSNTKDGWTDGSRPGDEGSYIVLEPLKGSEVSAVSLLDHVTARTMIGKSTLSHDGKDYSVYIWQQANNVSGTEYDYSDASFTYNVKTPDGKTTRDPVEGYEFTAPDNSRGTYSVVDAIVRFNVISTYTSGYRGEPHTVQVGAFPFMIPQIDDDELASTNRRTDITISKESTALKIVTTPVLAENVHTITMHVMLPDPNHPQADITRSFRIRIPAMTGRIW